ncbi:inorganic pyrophosphatase [Syncephalastrum racemosum]|uniref:inorganic diphosphatase n=1 Tax=Syncephalastrum racemosum TaxID=13706 RepID=A0A1X2HF77_SYNRA|nr:inorganic pyrophosphatase [Syncephalastrum racemosum]
MMTIYHTCFLTLSLLPLFLVTSYTYAHEYNIRQMGELGSDEFALYLEDDKGEALSFFHDVPLHPFPEDMSVYNMVVEIPRYHSHKLEIQKEIAYNPIKQKIGLDNELKFIADDKTGEGYKIGSYGALPQTWEDPDEASPDANTRGGDNDPIDCVEIGDGSGIDSDKVTLEARNRKDGGGAYPGQIKQVKLLGGLLMLDNGETDWKLIVLDVNDPAASSVNDIADIDSVWPGRLDSIRNWFETYKPGRINQFAYDGAFKNSTFVMRVVQHGHERWRSLIAKPRHSIQTLMHTKNATRIGM